MGRGGQAGGDSATFPWFLLFCLFVGPEADIPEDLHNEQVDGEHEEGALKANHHLLPCELDLPWHRQEEKREGLDLEHGRCLTKPRSLTEKLSHLIPGDG